MAAKREIVLIRKGCRVMWKDSLAKSSAMIVGYVGHIRGTKAGLEECHLYDEEGRLMHASCLLGDMWHVSATHKQCKEVING